MKQKARKSTAPLKAVKSEKEKMKILLLNYEFPPIGGGGGVASYDLALEWVKESHVDVLTMSFKGLAKHETVNGINIYRSAALLRKSRDVTPFITMMTYMISAFFKGIVLMRKNRYDVINTHFAVPTGPVGFLLNRLFKIPNVLSLHGGDIYDPSKKTSPHKSFFYRKIIRVILNAADAVVAQSSNTRDNAVKYYNTEHKIDIIPLPFHAPDAVKTGRKELGMEAKSFYFVTVGRLIKRKSIDTMLNGLAAAKISPSVKLLIIGDGPELPHLKRLSEKLGLADNVKFLGYLPNEEKFSYLANADCYIMTSLHEGFGIVFMEAMHCGLPIISTNHGGQTDFLASEKSGLLIDVGDVKGCAEAVKRIMTDKPLYKKCSENNKATVKRFAAKNVAGAYTGIFHDLLQSDRR